MIRSPLNPGPDLDDPAVLAREAESLAGGMQQQANMAQTGTAMSGHPNPGWFYGHVSQVLFKLAALARHVAFDRSGPDGVHPVGIDGVLPPQQGVPYVNPNAGRLDQAGPPRLTVVDTFPEAATKPPVDDEGVPEPPPVADAPARRGRPPKAKADEQPVG